MRDPKNSNEPRTGVKLCALVSATRQTTAIRTKTIASMLTSGNFYSGLRPKNRQLPGPTEVDVGDLKLGHKSVKNENEKNDDEESTYQLTSVQCSRYRWRSNRCKRCL